MSNAENIFKSLTATLLLLFPVYAFPDFSVLYTSYDSSNKEDGGYLEVLVKEGQVRLKGSSNSEHVFYVWFNSNTGLFKVSDPFAKGHYKFNSRLADRKLREWQKFKSEIEKKYEGHKEEDLKDAKRVVEFLYRKEFGGSEISSIAFENLNNQQRVWDQHCSEYLVLVNDTKARNTCINDFYLFKENPESLNSLKAMGMEGLKIANSTQLISRFVPAYAVDLSQGFPMQMIFKTAESIRTLSLTDVSYDELSNDLFNLPESLSKALPLNLGLKTN